MIYITPESFIYKENVFETKVDAEYCDFCLSTKNIKIKRNTQKYGKLCLCKPCYDTIISLKGKRTIERSGGRIGIIINQLMNVSEIDEDGLAALVEKTPLENIFRDIVSDRLPPVPRGYRTPEERKTGLKITDSSLKPLKETQPPKEVIMKSGLTKKQSKLLHKIQEKRDKTGRKKSDIKQLDALEKEAEGLRTQEEKEKFWEFMLQYDIESYSILKPDVKTYYNKEE